MKDKDKSPMKYSLDTIFLFPFNKSLYMPLFPSRTKIPKSDKYDGNSDPQDHVQEFCSLCMEFMHKKTYLMCLFPRSLGGQAMEWFSSLPVGIKSFEELVELFLQQYSYNIHLPVTMIELCNTKQKIGEPFLTFLQRWRKRFSRYSQPIPDFEKMDIFVNNLIPELKCNIQMQVYPSFNKMVDSALKMEDMLVRKGDISLYKETHQGSSSKEKNKYWKYGKDNNRNIFNNEVVDNIKTKSKPIVFNLTSRTQALKAAKSATENPPKKSKEYFKEKPWVSKPKHVFTPLDESYESAFKTLLAKKLITFSNNSKPYDPEVKPKWWRENEYYEYHQNKGHTTNNYMKLKHKIQDLIDASKIVVGNHATNVDHKAFKDPLPSYEQGDSSKSKEVAKVNYTYANNENVINMIESSQPEYCNVIIVKDKQNKMQIANVVTHSQKKVTLKGAISCSLDQTSLNLLIGSNLPTSSNKQLDTIIAKSK